MNFRHVVFSAPPCSSCLAPEHSVTVDDSHGHKVGAWPPGDVKTGADGVISYVLQGIDELYDCKERNMRGVNCLYYL